MASADPVEAFTSTKETVREAGVEDDFFLDLIASRLLVERIGESNNQEWWDSRVLSETGRARLSEVTPKTQLKSRIDLAMKVGRKAESDRIQGDSISLFSFGPQMESRLDAALDDLEADENQTLASLETLSTQSLSEGWTDPIIAETAANISGSSDSETFEKPASGRSYLLDDTGYTQDEIEPEKWRLFTTLLRGYGYCTDQLQVPYYRLTSAITSENEG